jgi:diguanylate cyclase (GGDEF)-like protein
MSATMQRLSERYATALRDHMSTPDNEEKLFQAYEIGRAAIDSGAGVLDMVRLHHAALRAVIAGDHVLNEKSIETAAAFFVEALSTFEMLLRGYRENNAVLVETNAMLRQAKAAAELANRELERLATIDPLTGVSNRRHFHALAALEIERAVRFGQPLSALTIDVDHFKSINDMHGHISGDAALRRLVETAREELRGNDLLARMGGDEFVALLPNTDVLGALTIAERLRSRTVGLTIECEGHRFSIAISVGIAGFSTGEETIDSTLARADQALYRAKTEGRNRVSLAAQPASKQVRGRSD